MTPEEFSRGTPGRQQFDMKKLSEQLRSCQKLEGVYMVCLNNIAIVKDYTVEGSLPQSGAMINLGRLASSAEFKAEYVLELLQKQAADCKADLESAMDGYCTITGLPSHDGRGNVLR